MLGNKWENSECKLCPIGDKYLWNIANRPCIEHKRIVLKGNFCACKPDALVEVKTISTEQREKLG